jgi:LPXTG-motif cell wall-anchored protein
VGYLFGKHWEALLDLLQDANIAIAVAVLVVVAFFWWRKRRKN